MMTPIDATILRRHAFLGQQVNNERAKHFLMWSSIYDVCVLLIGVVSFLVIAPAVLGVIATFITFVSFICRWYSDTLKDASQSLYRRYEYADALGWEISQKEVSDALFTLPKKSQTAILNATQNVSWFASQQAQGPKRLLENLGQNACWTTQIAKRTFIVYLLATIVIFSLGVLLLFAGTLGLLPQDAQQPIARTVIAIFVFVLTGGYVRYCLEYWALSRDTNAVDERVCELLAARRATKDDVIKLYMDYQLVRAKGPLLPTWIYRWLRSNLEKTCQRVVQVP